MKILIQRVSEASVTIDGTKVSSIGNGLVALVGVQHGDTLDEVRFLAEKMVALRIFNDEAGKMNLSLLDVDGSALIVSQFTLLADTRRGRRPAFTDAAAPEIANQLYEAFAREVNTRGVPVQTGVFAADMKVALVNDGPVTIMLERVPENRSN